MKPAATHAHTLLGMHTRAAWVIAGFFVLSEVTIAVTSWRDIDDKFSIVAALLICAGAGAALLGFRVIHYRGRRPW